MLVVLMLRGIVHALGPSYKTDGEPVEDLTLIPYGCAKLRVTEFPRLEK